MVPGRYTTPRYANRLGLERIAAPVRAVDDSYNALIESAIGLYKTELIDRNRPSHTPPGVEPATLQHVNWFNHERIHTAIGKRLPLAHEASYQTATPPVLVERMGQ